MAFAFIDEDDVSKNVRLVQVWTSCVHAPAFYYKRKSSGCFRYVRGGAVWVWDTFSEIYRWLRRVRCCFTVHPMRLRPGTIIVKYTASRFGLAECLWTHILGANSSLCVVYAPVRSSHPNREIKKKRWLAANVLSIRHFSEVDDITVSFPFACVRAPREFIIRN